jgi:hypothetical protein
MEQRVAISISDGIADVRLVRADKMNALDAARDGRSAPVSIWGASRR